MISNILNDFTPAEKARQASEENEVREAAEMLKVIHMMVTEATEKGLRSVELGQWQCTKTVVSTLKEKGYRLSYGFFSTMRKLSW